MREVMLIVHFIGLTMGVGTGFAHAFLGSVVSKMTTEEATKFRLHSLVISKMGNIGIVLLIVSGFYLITPFWKTLSTTPLLIAKLLCVSILIIFIVLINVAASRARAGDAEAQFKKMKGYGKVTLLLSIAIIVLAVYVFH